MGGNMAGFVLILIGFIIGACVFHPPLRDWILGYFRNSLQKRRERKEAEAKAVKTKTKRKTTRKKS